MGKKYLKYIGSSLIILSFIIYGMIPVIIKSSLSISIKTILGIGVYILSWGMFFVGVGFGGKEIWNKYKKSLCKCRSK